MVFEILVPIHTYPDGSAASFALHCAAIARYLSADVHAVVLNADFPPVSSALGNLLIDVPSLIGGAKAVCRERGALGIASMESALGPLGIPLRTTHIECFPGAAGDVVAALARYHDAVIIGIGATDSIPQATAEAALFGSGRPVILVPENALTASFKHVVIAWDGSQVAARAVSDARDFLRLADKVTILSITDEKPLPDNDLGGRLASYLVRHSIKAEVVNAESKGCPIAETLQDRALEIGAGILVMGGFAHSRMRDFVLGGATSGILKNLQLTTLLSH